MIPNKNLNSSWLSSIISGMIPFCFKICGCGDLSLGFWARSLCTVSIACTVDYGGCQYGAINYTAKKKFDSGFLGPPSTSDGHVFVTRCDICSTSRKKITQLVMRCHKNSIQGLRELSMLFKENNQVDTRCRLRSKPHFQRDGTTEVVPDLQNVPTGAITSAGRVQASDPNQALRGNGTHAYPERITQEKDEQQRPKTTTKLDSGMEKTVKDKANQKPESQSSQKVNRKVNWSKSKSTTSPRGQVKEI
ncbi:hypothetical protein Tco_1459291 [Tanacetum coccineum]